MPLPPPIPPPALSPESSVAPASADSEHTLGLRACLSILMPVYNEYPYVRECIRRVLEAPLPDGVARELIVVDDASTDGTREILATLAEEHTGVLRVILHKSNGGKGAAIRTAIEAMQGDLAIFQDADLEYDPRDYARVLTPILDGDADVVYGSRFAFPDQRRVVCFRHAIGNRLLTLASNWFTDLYLTDMETCYKAFRTSILKSIPLRSNDFALEPEITAKVAKRSCTVYEVPIAYRGRSYEEGKKIGWRDGFRAFYAILKYAIIDDCHDGVLDSRVLQSMNRTQRYCKWMTDLARPHLGRRVLELGSGTGSMGRLLCGGRHVLLTDSNPACLKFLENQFRWRDDVSIDALEPESDAEFQRFHGRGVDTVVAFNLLERVEDDAVLLARVHALLPMSGRFVVQVPCHPHLFGTLDEEAGHLRRYRKSAFVAQLRGAGFEVACVRSVNWFGVAVWYLNGVLLRRRRMGRIQLKIFDTLVPLLRWMDWIPLPGLSLFIVARKV